MKSASRERRWRDTGEAVDAATIEAGEAHEPGE